MNFPRLVGRFCEVSCRRSSLWNGSASLPGTTLSKSTSGWFCKSASQTSVDH